MTARQIDYVSAVAAPIPTLNLIRPLKVFYIDNLKYQQYRWDDRAIFYYVDSDGNLCARVNSGVTYISGVSED